MTIGVLDSGQSSWNTCQPNFRLCYIITFYLFNSVLITGDLEALVQIAVQSFDTVFAVLLALQVAEQGLAAIFVAHEARKPQVDHDIRNGGF